MDGRKEKLIFSKLINNEKKKKEIQNQNIIYDIKCIVLY